MTIKLLQWVTQTNLGLVVDSYGAYPDQTAKKCFAIGVLQDSTYIECWAYQLRFQSQMINEPA